MHSKARTERRNRIFVCQVEPVIATIHVRIHFVRVFQLPCFASDDQHVLRESERRMECPRTRSLCKPTYSYTIRNEWSDRAEPITKNEASESRNLGTEREAGAPTWIRARAKSRARSVAMSRRRETRRGRGWRAGGRARAARRRARRGRRIAH